MTDIILQHMTNGQNVSAANTNFDTLQDNINNHSLQKDGGNNVLFQDLDLNSNNLLNVKQISAQVFKLGTVTLIPSDVQAIDPVILASLLQSPPPIGFLVPNSANFTQISSVSTVNSLSPSTGSIVTAGGVGIVKDIWCGGTYNGLAAITGGSINATPIGATTKSTGAFTILSATGATTLNTLTATGGIANTSIGFLGASSGYFTTLSVNTGISGTGFTNYFASPPALGGTAPNAGSFTNLTATGTLTGFPGRLLNIQIFTANGTYTPTAGTNKVIVEVQGAGGGGGGCAATVASQSSAGVGGGAGAYAKVLLTTGFSGQAITVAAGGTGGAVGNNSGTTPTATSFGTIIVCNGGNGGGGSAGQASPIYTGNPTTTNTPTVSSGTILAQSPGGKGETGTVLLAGTTSMSGTGAATPFGGGGAGRTAANNGQAGVSFGSGGGGGNQPVASSAGFAGGNGASGIIIVYEFS